MGFFDFSGKADKFGRVKAASRPTNSTPPESPRNIAFEVSRGSVSVQVYPLKARGHWQVCWYAADGSRTRRTFALKQEAEAFAKARARELSRQASGVRTLSTEESASYEAARRILDPLGVPLHIAAQEYARRHPANRPKKAVSDVVREILAEDKSRGLSRAYQETQGILLGIFARSVVMPIANVRPDDIQEYLANRPVSAKSVLHERAAIVRLFNYARRRNYITREHAAEIADVPKPRLRPAEVLTITASDLVRFLDAAPWGELARKAKIKYSRNALRHSCISAHLAREQDPARVAFWAGNSARVIQQAYWARWTPSLSDEWFAVRPPGSPSAPVPPLTGSGA